MEAYVLEINKPEHYWSFLNTDAVELIWVISAISSECLDEYFRNAPIIVGFSSSEMLKPHWLKIEIDSRDDWH